MIFAQTEWDLRAGAAVLVLGVVFKFVLDFQSKKNERAVAAERFALEQKSAAERTQVLKDIATSNQAIREGQLAQNGKLSTIMKINDDRHEEMIRALSSTCRSRIGPSPRKQEPTKET